jgi:hypothetical protein
MKPQKAKKQKRALRTCRACGEFFTPYRSNQRACSAPCRLSFWRVRNRSIRITTDKIGDHDSRLSAVETAIRSMLDANLAKRIADLESMLKALTESR